MKKLRISPEVLLPAEAMTLTSAVLGIRGSGKTNSAVVVTEELLDAGQQVVVVDPLDVWWGLKSSADGKHDGYPVVVLGGIHADLPLSCDDGRAVADFLVENRVPAVLSLRHLKKGEQKRFVADFAEQLYQRKGESGRNTPLLVVIDEASSFVPQSFQGDSARMVGAIEDLVRRGRASGLGVMLIDQRAASVNKDVLTQLELLIAHRHTSPQDRAALKLWVQAHDTGDQEKAFMDSLASLPRGSAWLWSPGWLDLFCQTTIRKRRTFDSSATPALGKAVAIPEKLAAPDLEKLRAALAATVEEEKANDPKALKTRIAELEKAAKAKPDFYDSDERKRMVCQLNEREAIIATLKVRDRDAEFIISRQQQTMLAMRAHLEQLSAQFVQETEKYEVAHREWKDAPREGGSTPGPSIPIGSTPSQPLAQKPTTAKPPQPSLDSSNPGAKMSGAARKVLTVLAQHETRNKTQIALLTGYSSKGGSFNNTLSALRSAGWIEGGKEQMKITEEGRSALGQWTALPTGKALVEYWVRELPKAEGLILQYLVGAYPRSESKEEIAEHISYEPTGGGFNNALSRLRTLQLISGSKDALIASDVFFE